MPCGDIVNIHCESFAEQRVKFKVLVTGNAGVRGSSLSVFADKVVNDLLAEHILEIHYIKINTELVADAARVLNRAFGAAALVICVVIVRVCP